MDLQNQITLHKFYWITSALFAAQNFVNRQVCVSDSMELNGSHNFSKSSHTKSSQLTAEAPQLWNVLIMQIHFHEIIARDRNAIKGYIPLLWTKQYTVDCQPTIMDAAVCIYHFSFCFTLIRFYYKHDDIITRIHKYALHFLSLSELSRIKCSPLLTNCKTFFVNCKMDLRPLEVRFKWTPLTQHERCLPNLVAWVPIGLPELWMAV
jgi:hypothetical protein